MTTSISDVVPANRSRRCGDTPLRYRLDVIGSDVADVVRSAGGWLYDRAAAGWEVNVLVSAAPDARALQILGARQLDLDAALDTALGGAGLAVSITALTTDARIRDVVCKALDHSLIEVTLWGDDCPLPEGRSVTVVQHPLTTAARVFKSQALAAVGIACEDQGLTETFLSDMGTCLPIGSDLQPATARQ